MASVNSRLDSDALLTWKKRTPLLDQQGNPVTRWDGVSTRRHPTTGQDIPDEEAHIAVYEYADVKQAEWPEADFVVGNTPFIGRKDIRAELGDGYVKALRKAYDLVPDSADFVMYWWQRTAERARAGKIRRFGFITNNSFPRPSTAKWSHRISACLQMQSSRRSH